MVMMPAHFHGYRYNFISKNGIWLKLPVSGQILPVIKSSIKSKNNIDVNVSSKKTSFWDKDGEKYFRELPVFGQR